MVAERDGKAAILGAIRRSLGRGALSADAAGELDERIARHRPSLRPARGAVAGTERIDLFQEMAEAAACTVERVAGIADLPAAVAAFLRTHNLPPALVLAPDPLIAEAPWDAEPMLESRVGAPRGGDPVGVTSAAAAVAETGTLVMTSGPEHPATLNFLPDYHIVALPASRVLGQYEDAWASLRDRFGIDREGRSELPRTVNLITGPSRTGDIELTIQLGAHGPRSLHIVLIEDDESAGSDQDDGETADA